MFYRFEQLFDVTKYPAGENHVEASRLPRSGDTIIAMTMDFNALMDCVVANEILTRHGVQANWVLPYMPFARHDRRNHRFDGLELPFAIDLVNSINGVVIDPHSDVAGLLPHYTQADVVLAFAGEGLFDTEDAIVVIPDAGAIKKVHTWLPEGMTTVQCLKTRDPSTGKLSAFKVLHDVDLEGREVIIVDDLCDGGGTFLGLANVLEAHNAGDFKLAVTHGLFTKGVDDLKRHFCRIYTLDVYRKAGIDVTYASTTDMIKESRPL